MMNLVAAAASSTPNAERHTAREALTWISLIIVGIVLIATLAVTVFREPTHQLMNLLNGQHVDPSEAGFTPPDLKVTVSLPTGTTPMPNSHVWTTVTIENQGSGTLSPVVTLSVPSTGPVDVRAARGFSCKSKMVPFLNQTIYHVVTCRGGLVSSTAPTWISVGGVVPTGAGPYPIVAKASTRFGIEDANTADNLFGLEISPTSP
jgi:hypothetical protein